MFDLTSLLPEPVGEVVRPLSIERIEYGEDRVYMLSPEVDPDEVICMTQRGKAVTYPYPLEPLKKNPNGDGRLGFFPPKLTMEVLGTDRDEMMSRLRDQYIELIEALWGERGRDLQNYLRYRLIHADREEMQIVPYTHPVRGTMRRCLVTFSLVLIPILCEITFKKKRA